MRNRFSTATSASSTDAIIKTETAIGKLATLAFCETGNRGGKNQQPMHSQGIKEQIAVQS
jgi:hypothetical protein